MYLIVEEAARGQFTMVNMHLTRIGAILALIASVIWAQWPLDTSRIGLGPLVSILASFITWVAIEFQDNVPVTNHYDEDVEKINRILNLIDRNQYYILKKKLIQTTIRSDDYRGLENFLYYAETDNQFFNDQELRNMYSDLIYRSKRFLDDLWTLYTDNGLGMATWRSPGKPYVSDDEYKEIQLKIRKLDNIASKIASNLDDIVKQGQLKLRKSKIKILYFS